MTKTSGRTVFRKIMHKSQENVKGTSDGYDVRLPTNFVKKSNKRFAKLEVVDKNTIVLSLQD